MSLKKIYRTIRRRCNLVCTERSHDYEWRTEYWKHNNIQYTVLIRVTPRREIVRSIRGCTIN